MLKFRNFEQESEVYIPVYSYPGTGINFYRSHKGFAGFVVHKECSLLNRLSDLCGLYFKSSIRKHPDTGKLSSYPASELKTTRWIKDNSAVSELTGYDIDQITKDKLYQSALHLYQVKDALEKHLSRRTNELFDLADKIILYDLTNTYFEGEKRNSTLARFGRSKEKRADAKLVVLALVVNTEGFIKYSFVLQGNIADNKTLSAMIEKLSSHTCGPGAVVVLDAGIATEENIALVAEKGYKYLCVSRSKLRDYQAVPDRLTVLMDTKSNQA